MLSTFFLPTTTLRRVLLLIKKKKVGEDSYHNIVTEETVSGDSFRFMQKQLDEGKSAKEAYEAMVKADEDALADVGAATSKDGES